MRRAKLQFDNMQTFSSSFETRQSLPPHLGNQSTTDLIEGSSSGTVVSSSLSTEEIVTSFDIRPITPEISYPYPLYKGGDYYKRRLAMKPNQVGLNSGGNILYVAILLYFYHIQDNFKAIIFRSEPYISMGLELFLWVWKGKRGYV